MKRHVERRMGRKMRNLKRVSRHLEQACRACSRPTLRTLQIDTNGLFNVEELSEEDQQLKSELEMLVERLKVC